MSDNRNNKYEFYSDTNFSAFWADIVMRSGYDMWILYREGERGGIYLLKSVEIKLANAGLRFYSDKRKVRALIRKGEKIRKLIDKTMSGKQMAGLKSKTDAEVKKILKQHFTQITGLTRVYVYSETFNCRRVDETIKDFIAKLTADPKAVNRNMALLLNTSLDSVVEAEREKALNELVAPAIIRTLCESVREMGKSKMILRESVNRSFVFLKSVFAEIGRRKYLSLGQVEACRLEEVIGLLEGKMPDMGEINRRADLNFAFCRGGKTRFYTGAKAKQWIARVKPFDAQDIREIFGNPASAGIVIGRVIIMPTMFVNHGKDFREKMKLMKKGDILVANTTGPEMIMACRMASAIVANESGINSHAAIVSRELGIPSIVGTKIATRVLRDGDIVEVDADKGIVRILEA